ncbi:tyrosine-type recombinase/integrase [Xenorhabdus griffiniae]|uniref:Integrase arm-type DNA-binding domain-containing protein n=1 Tax=Xenorhabdus griffiniae TaxID=351672 RepID=A0ABY9XME0_9GAMM|nr:integrase arm-type DNA-binding domain-containing protein [Xenorhabdus griffiniae]MBD1228596.1 integrase arm-type DNA-binding domain-containing protein [Xenorhabdus griffiniae]MBE8588121.1 integrase arm-type DNA-binding domain-containing protein [Xenorhabdus griffiniae]WMV74090.1 integrase arm-type DNA-binding domain-containing protein [Xenorhabdus griffiniae]WNH03770.1 integrase arm-type DNA-binding domain-containing protein [Xenorhabdus griffiniae]
MKLNARLIETAKPKEKTYKLSDGGGLYLEVTARGSKYWRMKYYRPTDKKEDRLAFGVYPTISLADARAKRDEAKRLIAQGIDPKAEKKEAHATSKGKYTFEKVACDWHASNKRWSKDHSNRIMRSLEHYIFPHIGKLDISTLRTSQLLVPIKLVDADGKHDIAQRLQQRVTSIMRYAVQNDILDSNPANDMAGALSTVKAKHHPALPHERLPEFLTRLSRYHGRLITRIAVELTLLTFVRSSELRFARWEELDLENAIWKIPATRKAIEGVKFSERGMKMKTEHIVPLSRQAVILFKSLRELSGDCEVMFPNDHDPQKVMSESTVNNALRGMGYNTKTDVCGHGFRTMARGAMGESGLWNDDAIERQLSHVERKNVRAAYIHTSKHLDERRLMVQWWADYLDANREKHITPYDFAKKRRK